MDLVQIKKKDYSVGNLVEGYSSLIWTERFQSNGEFELHTEDIAYTMALLPKRSFCSLIDSGVVMMIDDHNITTNDSGAEELTVTGRSLDIFLKNRVWTNAPYGKAVGMAKKYSIREAVEVLIWNSIANGTGNDRIKTSASYPAANRLPNVIVTDSVPPSSDGPAKTRKMQNGEVYDQMMTFLKAGKLGVRIIRPVSGKGRRVDVAGDGTHSTTHINGIEDLRFDIYKGRDLSNKVVFTVKMDDIDEAEYLFSDATLKTGIFVDGDPREHYYTDPEVIAGSNAGWNRFDGYVDGGSKEDGETADDFEESLEDLGLRSLRQGRSVNAVSGKISLDVNFVYNKDYRLGDIVRLQGKYGAADKKYITEFVRTKDDNGISGYPTLSDTLSS